MFTLSLHISHRRMCAALSSGRMFYRGYRLSRWADGAWHVYKRGSRSCEGEFAWLNDALRFVDSLFVVR